MLGKCPALEPVDKADAAVAEIEKMRGGAFDRTEIVYIEIGVAMRRFCATMHHEWQSKLIKQRDALVLQHRGMQNYGVNAFARRKAAIGGYFFVGRFNC